MGSVSNYIFLYKGQETDSLCAEAAKQSLYQLIPDAHRRIIEIKDPSLLSSRECLTQRNLLVIPGGSALEMSENSHFSSLSENLQAALKANTVSYLGICAGSYLAPWLNLTPSKCYSPRSCLLIPHEIQAAPITCVGSGETFHVVRSGGGYYKETDPSEIPIAYYQSSEEIAILRPRANVVLSNVHPEFQLNNSYIREHLRIDDAAAEKLLADSSRQQQLLVDILKLLDVEASAPQKSESEKVQSLFYRRLLEIRQIPFGLETWAGRVVIFSHTSNSPMDRLRETAQKAFQKLE
jgi:glutamine amidotransferase-like uncharacterized protein